MTTGQKSAKPFGVEMTLTAVLAGMVVGIGLGTLEAEPDPCAAWLVRTARDVQVAGTAAPWDWREPTLDGRSGPTGAVTRMKAEGVVGTKGAIVEGTRVTRSRDGGGPPDVYVPLDGERAARACARAARETPVRVACVADPVGDAPGTGFMLYRGGFPDD